MSMQWKSAVAVAAVAFFAGCGEPVTEGETAYKTYCLSCHGTKGVGGIGPNVTFSATAGIASWSGAQVLTLVRTGTDKEGMQTCKTMTRFSATQLSDAKVALIYDYLKTLKNDTVNKGSSCP